MEKAAAKQQISRNDSLWGGSMAKDVQTCEGLLQEDLLYSMNLGGRRTQCLHAALTADIDADVSFRQGFLVRDRNLQFQFLHAAPFVNCDTKPTAEVARVFRPAFLMCPALPSCRVVEVKEHVAIRLRRTCGGVVSKNGLRYMLLRIPNAA